MLYLSFSVFAEITLVFTDDLHLLNRVQITLKWVGGLDHHGGEAWG